MLIPVIPQEPHSHWQWGKTIHMIEPGRHWRFEKRTSRWPAGPSLWGDICILYLQESQSREDSCKNLGGGCFLSKRLWATGALVVVFVLPSRFPALLPPSAPAVHLRCFCQCLRKGFDHTWCQVLWVNLKYINRLHCFQRFWDLRI